MTTKGNIKGLDVLGNEVLWSSRGEQVMMQWERHYMELCVDALSIRPTDRVLEIGFGLAYSSTHIQKFHPRTHTIIECDLETLRRAQEFAKRHCGVKVVAGTWQQCLPTLDIFDCVFFDDYPLPELEQINNRIREETASGKRSRWHDFLDVALKHCTGGARISGYLAREVALQRPGCQVKVTRVKVDVPENCSYFPYKEALVPVITVVDPITAATLIDAKAIALLPLPHLSKKFQRAFERPSSLEITLQKGAPEWRKKVVDIRNFLLEDEVDVAIDNQRNDIGGSCTIDSDMTSALYKRGDSRLNYLCALKTKAAASKDVIKKRLHDP
ncbi:Guanidinoacetate methyltransferase and related proteins [Plasmopara halstedii]|uniref:Guanidinoacetate methyltransferase and related proteins n=1 Tax=Plasmopara halstedii TaxID=4781 RepID=A0A0P1AAC8_PLAHL|nr:Guanidinoacetate methyltransferase and related proteins [Plasmopara halstedii]CEG37509.1 Guanidinoacetate methyltransferase and related proteins [Plasmopara halstedii]|eukprot:XP_024573878.1 Guanidinoacetate methyltransferase and related proteins [Plasmopara halstedii]